MSAMDEFTELKKIKEGLLKYEWSAEGNIVGGLRFFSNDGNRTSEHRLTEEEKRVLDKAMQHVERIGSSISYNPYRGVADGVRQVLLHYCGHKLKELAQQAKKEARAVLDGLGE